MTFPATCDGCLLIKNNGWWQGGMCDCTSICVLVIPCQR